MIKKDTVIIIPAYNEEASIALVLKDIPRDRIIEIILVDNASTDNTASIAQKNGAMVISCSQRGYGIACLSGIKKAYALNPANIVFLDADYSDHPQELPLLLDKIDCGYDLVIGSRTLGKSQKGALLPQAIFGNWLATNLMSLLLQGLKFSDLGPFRAIKTQALKQLKMQDQDFGWTIEMQAKALLQKLRCCEVSVSYRKRIGVSKITGTLKGTIAAGYKILKTLFTLWPQRYT